MNYNIQDIAFPCCGVSAVAAQNKDGSYTIYVNALESEANRDSAARYLVDQINRGA